VTSVLALVFPGQGSQEVGMGRDVCEVSRAAREVFEAADDALGFALSKLCFEGPEDELRRTEIQQPAILATCIALLRALEERTPVAPAYNAGHSLGEYAALVASGSLGLDDAVRMVHARGRFMQEAVPDGHGAMAAVIGAAEGELVEACRLAAAQTGRVVTPANYNAPGQIVIAGDAAAVEVACALARERGAKRTIPLAVSAPFHCALMAPAAGKLALELARVRFGDARPPIVTNVEAEPNELGARFPELLRAQVTAPVRFVEMMQKLRILGVTKLLEIGPGRVLTGLIGRIDRSFERANLAVQADLPAAVKFVSGVAD
jgi:[acyl-carrier-protein] S-malonyltransferase